MTDIVERLEAEAKLPGADKWMLQEAADIIKRLTAEIRDGKSQSKDAIRELRAEIERLQASLKMTNGGERQLSAYLKLEAEITRLRAALKKIAELRYAEDANEPFDEALDTADAALEPTP